MDADRVLCAYVDADKSVLITRGRDRQENEHDLLPLIFDE